MTRRDPNMTEKLACALLQWLEALGEPIPRGHAQLMSPDQICSLFQFDHYPIRYIDGGTTHPDNLMPKFIAAHRKKTAEIDVPQIRKADRIRKKRTPQIAKIDGHEIEFVIDDDNPGVARRPDPERDPELFVKPRRRKINSRGFQKGHRPIRSRGFERRTT